MVDQDTAHQPSEEAEELFAVLPPDRTAADEPEVDLVDQSGGLEGLVGRLVLDAGDEIHTGLGLGATYERFQVDFGVDVSDLRDTFAISAVYFF